MRNKKWDLVWGIIAVLILISSLIDGNETKSIFGLEINIWIYRGLWLFIAITNLSQFFIRRKKESISEK